MTGATQTTKSFSGKSILVVDDEPLLCEALEYLLKREGAEVLTAGSGKAAFEMLKSARFDAVISDVRMPRGDGISLIRKIHEELHYRPACFLCTGFSDIEMRDVEKYGVRGIIDKPFDYDELMRRLQETL